MKQCTSYASGASSPPRQNGQRALREVRAGLTVADDVHPLPREWVEAQVAQGIGHPAILARMPAARLRHPVRRMTAEDVDVIATVMARAFWDDPLQVWVFPDAETRLDRLDRMFALQIRLRRAFRSASRTPTNRVPAARSGCHPGRSSRTTSAVGSMEVLVPIVGDAIDAGCGPRSRR